MTTLDQRRVEELIERYKLEPSLRDIYVEGELDKGILDWTLDVRTNNNIAVYEIATVFISPEQVLGYGLYDNNKGRVIALAHLLRQHLAPDSLQVTCIVDKDLDAILNIDHNNELLLLTDYSCIEMYLYNTHTIDKFLQLAVRRFNKTAEEVLRELTPILENLFLARLANETLRLGLSEIQFERYCSLSRSNFNFDFAGYIRNYLISNRRAGELERFTQEIDRLRPLLNTDPRFQINGHDFIRLFACYIGKHRPRLRQTFDTATVERMLFTAIERNQLNEDELFMRLAQRVHN